MNITYIFGGYLLTAGTLDNGSPWQGVNIMYGECRNGNAPMCGKIAKGRRTDSLVSALQKLHAGDFVEFVCDPSGKVLDIKKAQ